MEEQAVKEVYKPNREQRRKMAREQRRADNKLHKNKVESSKVNGKLIGLVDAIKEKAVKVKEETGIDKMYFCINADNIKDSLIIKYVRSEKLKDSLGVKTDITLDNGVVRVGNIVLYAEVTQDNVVNIEDGKGVYLDREEK